MDVPSKLPGEGIFNASAQVKDLLAKHRQDQEDYLLNFFGSYEEAVRLAKYFVIEEYPIKFPDRVFDLDDNTYSYALYFECRIRHKTQEEIQAMYDAEDSQDLQAL